MGMGNGIRMDWLYTMASGDAQQANLQPTSQAIRAVIIARVTGIEMFFIFLLAILRHAVAARRMSAVFAAQSRHALLNRQRAHFRNTARAGASSRTTQCQQS